MGIDADDGQGGLCRRSAVRGGNLATEHMTPLWVHRARMEGHTPRMLRAAQGR
ncbi:MAG: hypothetical protein HUU30_02290 [Burkholderiaceae bacterium]|jgi:hypothetical protein|nr:hypothetical protein [Aquabacterium sp.]NUP84573.1 hypothetical protein [Burkholderiaceae bacterium]